MNRCVQFSQIALLFFLVSIATQPAVAQQNDIPNASFESWPGIDPTDWIASYNLEENFGTAEPDGDAQDGVVSARLTVKSVPGLPGVPVNAGLETCPGACRDEDGNTIGEAIFPVSGRQEAFCGYYKGNFSPGNFFMSASMLVGENLIGFTTSAINESTDDWTKFVFPIAYQNNQTPNQGAIAIGLTGPIGSMVFVDNLFYCDLNGNPVGGGGGNDGDALLIIDDADDPDFSDLNIEALLTNLGFDPVTVSDEDAQATDADGKSLIVISATVDPTSLSANYAQTAVPLITWEPELYPSLGMTDNGMGFDIGFTDAVTTLTLLDAAHPIANGFVGDATVYADAAPMSYGRPSSSASLVARADGQTTIFTYSAGAPMLSGMAPARRVGFFMNENGVEQLTGAGNVLLENAILWTAGREGEIDTSVGVEPVGGEVPAAITLYQNYPNPFSRETTVSFRLQRSGHARLVVYDMQGREVTVLVDGMLPVGRYEAVLVARALASGTYYYRLSVDGTHVQGRSMLVTR